MEEKSKIKKDMFEAFINNNKEFIQSHIKGDKKTPNSAKNAEFKKELRNRMDSFQKDNKQKFEGQIFNTTDHYRIPIIYEFYDKYIKYWNAFTIGEMEFLGIFKNKHKDKDKTFKKVADEYMDYLSNKKKKDNDENKDVEEKKYGKNSITYLKALIGIHKKINISNETKKEIKNLTKLANRKNPDSLEIRKQIAYICRDLEITGEFIAHCNREKNKKK